MVVVPRPRNWWKIQTQETAPNVTAPDSSDQTCKKCIIVTIVALMVVILTIIIFRTEMFFHVLPPWIH